MKSLLKIILFVFIVFGLVAVAGIFYLTRGLESGSELVINGVNLSLLDNGAYSGKYNGGRWSNEVNVTIKDHKIIKIDVVKDVTFAKQDVKEELLNKVVNDQNTNIDVISGATVTCKAYLKAIENALIK